MKMNLVIIAIVLCFESAVAQTTIQQVTAYHNDTVELHVLTKILDSVPLKKLYLNEVSKNDADAYMLQGIKATKPLIVFSISRGLKDKKRIIKEDKTGLHYFFVYQDDKSGSSFIVGLSMLILAVDLLSCRYIFESWDWKYLLFTPTMFGLILSATAFSMNVGLNLGWDEALWQVALCFFIGALSVAVKNAAFLRNLLMRRIRALQPVR